MVPELPPPDLEISLHPDDHAPRAARHCVRTVDLLSPDLRDVVVLLTSELVTRAVMLRQTTSNESVELRIWMPSDVVRVELRGARELFCTPSEAFHPQDDLVLVETLADRWSIDTDEQSACVWFEIDRQQKAGQHGHAQGVVASARRS
jgi:hypothetical protein